MVSLFHLFPPLVPWKQIYLTSQEEIETVTTNRWTPYGQLQQAFIDQTRQSINADPWYFYHHNWEEINPPDLRKRVGPNRIKGKQFYVKGLVVWLPDMLPEPMGFTPTCPHCRSVIGVVATNDWVRRPKIVYTGGISK